MPTKENSAGQQQPYDANTGRFSSNSSGSQNQSKARDFDREIAEANKEWERLRAEGKSIFSPELRQATQKVNQLEAEKEGFSSYADLQEYRQKKALEEREKRKKEKAKEEKQKEDYMMAHRPTESGITADNLINEDVEAPMPNNFYDMMNKEALYDDEIKETMSQLNKVRNNPNAEIIIYRATKGDKINDGDWITLSKKYAEGHNEHSLNGEGKILQMKVKAKDIQFAGDDIKEWGYFPNYEEQKMKRIFGV